MFASTEGTSTYEPKHKNFSNYVCMSANYLQNNLQSSSTSVCTIRFLSLKLLQINRSKSKLLSFSSTLLTMSLTYFEYTVHKMILYNKCLKILYNISGNVTVRLLLVKTVTPYPKY